MEVKREARVGLVLAFLISLVTGTPISSDLQNEKPSSTSIPIPTENTPNDDSIIVPHPTLIDPLDPLDVKNVQYEENFIHPMNEELKTIIDTIDNIESNMGSQNSASDGKNLGHLIDLLEEIKRRIDLFKKDVAEILGPLALNGGFQRPHHHRHHFSGEFTQTSSTEIESTRPEKPETEDKPKPEVPLKIDSPTEEKPVVPTKDKVPAKPTKTDVNKTDETDIKKEDVETSGPVKTEKPTKTETSDPIKAETPTKADKKEPTKTETPTKTDKEEPTKTETPTETDKPAKEPIKEETPAEPAPAKTDFSSKFINPRAKRSPYRGFGGPYYGGGNFGGLGYGNGYGGGLYGGPYGGNRYSYGGYGGGYPYINNNGGWRPVLYG